MKLPLHFLTFTILIFSCSPDSKPENRVDKYPNYSGIYPHLAFYNSQGECGTGAVVPWAGKLWAVTYSPHEPDGSDDKLYEINENLEMTIKSESLGGTPANRMIHKESKQLFIGPYAIDDKGNVRGIPYDQMMGRHTGNARHLSDPASKLYYATMEEGFYEVDVQSLAITTLYEDGHALGSSGQYTHQGPLLPGAHGKGLYSGQGVLVYSNNGETSEEARKLFDVESGALAEWDGEHWTIARRNQFVEVTGPGGIYGNENPETDPIWATGFDHKSLLLGVRDPEIGWSFYRLPKGSHSYDGAHGWNTEWPRIRDVGTVENPDLMMTMHGMFWRFPKEFNRHNSKGIRPRSAYLKVIGDFARWNGRLVFGCDDSAQREFLNKRFAKGGIEGPGQSNSNLWFTPPELPDLLGPATACGAVWLDEVIAAGSYSESFLFSGWSERSVWIRNHSDQNVSIQFETDVDGDGKWKDLKIEEINGNSSQRIAFSNQEQGEWIRMKPNSDVKISVVFNYAIPDHRSNAPNEIFAGLSEVTDRIYSGGLLYGLGNNRRKLGISARDRSGKIAGYYELDSAMNLFPLEDGATQQFIENRFAIPRNVISVDQSSVLIVDDRGRRWRLPKGDERFDQLIENAETRICREVATERDLFNCHGTFYELPAENADGYAKIRPIASHNFRIHDYASYRGLLIISGIDAELTSVNEHIIKSDDNKLALWVGVIDDLWKMGKPTGEGGPWLKSEVEKDTPSDPYLIGFYDNRKMSLDHDLAADVTFTVEVNPMGYGPWIEYEQLVVENGQTVEHQFPKDFEARWVRVTADKDCIATAWFVYD